MPTVLASPAGIDVGTPRVLRVIRGYLHDQWMYRYISGPDGKDYGNQYCFRPGAFDASLASGSDIILSQDLDAVSVFARTGDGSMRITSDVVGLLLEAKLLDTPLNRRLCQQIDDGEVRGWSFGFAYSYADCVVHSIGRVRLVEIVRAELTEATIVIAKRPRQHHRTTPLFFEGGPRKGQKQ